MSTVIPGHTALILRAIIRASNDILVQNKQMLEFESLFNQLTTIYQLQKDPCHITLMRSVNKCTC